MKELEERIQRDGIVREGEVLKVDSFLNHQCDVELFDHMGAEWARLFAGKRVDKILTIEASGIGIACVVARHFGNVPVVFAKKYQSINLDGDQYCTNIYSFTKQKTYSVIVAKRFLNAGEHVIIIDDFLAKGNALNGLIDICESAGDRQGHGSRHGRDRVRVSTAVTRVLFSGGRLGAASCALGGASWVPAFREGRMRLGSPVESP